MGPAWPIFYDESTTRAPQEEVLTDVLTKERELQREIIARVEGDLDDVEVLAVELVRPERFTVYVDHPQGVDHALCAQVTDLLRDYLRDYGIDVSSPGPKRPLRKPEHFTRVVGRRIALRTPGRRLRGELVAADEEHVTIAVAGTPTEIPYDEIVRANLIDEVTER
jgi:ribosome maturation factor RimP